MLASDVSGWRVFMAGQDRVTAHAAKELAVQLAALPASGRAGRVTLTHADKADDGFEVEVGPEEVVLEGHNARGLLNAVYWLLERAGFVWVRPGMGGTRLGPSDLLPAGRTSSEPAIGRRTLILGQDALHDDWREWMEWASRNRLNDIFFHDTPPSVWDRGGAARPERHDEIADDRRGWMFELWDRDGDAIRAEAAKRGLGLQFGGHHLAALLERSLFDVRPEWFPLRNGQREARFNLCTSAPGAVAHVREGARAFFERFPGANVYHLWADDIRGGGWCECDSCAGLSPSEQALRATNIVAGVLAEVAPAARLAHLAYHDTLLPPEHETPAANVVCLFAPRERCYAHAIDEASCQRNREEYWTPYEGLLETFGNDRKRVAVFEYHSDAILFKGLAPPHLEVLPRDTAAYAATAGNLQNLMVGPRPWIGAPWHAWWMARAAWDPGTDADAELRRFWPAVSAEGAEGLVDYCRRADAACRLLLDQHDLAELPAHDVLDFSDTPRETMREKAREALEAAAALAEAAQALPEPGGDAEDFNREALQAFLVALISEHLAERLAAWVAAEEGDGAGGQAHLGKAGAALERLSEFQELFFDGAVGGSPAYANLRGVWSGMRRRTEQVEKLLERLP